MIATTELKKRAKAKLKDAEALYKSKRYDSSVYLCGYTIEFALKARICRTLDWSGFPESNSEFGELKCFKTHDLGVLLRLSGVESKVKTGFSPDWSIIESWNPEMRYNSIGGKNRIDAQSMIAATRNLLKQL